MMLSCALEHTGRLGATESGLHEDRRLVDAKRQLIGTDVRKYEKTLAAAQGKLRAVESYRAHVSRPHTEAIQGKLREL